VSEEETIFEFYQKLARIPDRDMWFSGGQLYFEDGGEMRSGRAVMERQRQREDIIGELCACNEVCKFLRFLGDNHWEHVVAHLSFEEQKGE